METIDVLYQLYFTQKQHTKACPTFVEKKILNEYLYKIKLYKWNHLYKIRKQVVDNCDVSKNSYFGWSAEHYDTITEKYCSHIDDLIYSIKISENPLENIEIKDETLHAEIENLYGKLLLDSKIRESLAEIDELQSVKTLME
jgi:hypothetical protein